MIIIQKTKDFKMLKIILFFILITHSVYAQQHQTQEKKQKIFMSDYIQFDKPKFQKAYQNYKRDLEIISLTGKIPPNQELEKDLKQMNSSEKFIYQQNTKK